MGVSLHGDPEYMTGTVYAQAYSLTIRVWSNSHVDNAGTIQAALETVVGGGSGGSHQQALVQLDRP